MKLFLLDLLMIQTLIRPLLLEIYEYSIYLCFFFKKSALIKERMCLLTLMYLAFPSSQTILT